MKYVPDATGDRRFEADNTVDRVGVDGLLSLDLQAVRGQGPESFPEFVAGLGSVYPIGYHGVMSVEHLLVQAREAAGLSQAALAAAAGTSRPTLSAYEHGRKSPTLETAARVVGEAGFDLTLTPKVEFHEAATDRGRPIRVPTTMPRLSLEDAIATVELPLHLNWSDRGRRYDLRDRRQRARVYEIVLREGGPADVLAYVDGALLVDLWDELVLPSAVRDAWNSVVTGGSVVEVA